MYGGPFPVDQGPIEQSMNAAASLAAEPVDGEEGVTPPATARELLLVAVAPDEALEFAEELVWTGKRFATALDCDWAVLCVETPPLLGNVRLERDTRLEMFRLAESLGAETVTLDAVAPADALAAYAKLREARQIIIGAPRRHTRLTLLRRSVVSSLLRSKSGAALIVIGREELNAAEEDGSLASGRIIGRAHWTSYGAALGISAVSTFIGLPLIDRVDLIDIVMIYMLGATVAALRLGRGPTILTAVANIIAFDYFFVPPRGSFYVSDPQYFVTFGIMLGVAIIIANLVTAVRQQSAAGGARERRTAALYEMSRQLAVTRDVDTMAGAAVHYLANLVQGPAVVLGRDEEGRLRPFRAAHSAASKRRPDMKICEWVAEHRQRAGLGSDSFPSERAIYMPLSGSQEIMGVLVVWPTEPRLALLPEPMRLLETIAGTLALALERVRLADVAQAARLAAERAALRSTLLASISHDLRTPLSVIAGAGSMMAHESFPLDTHRRTTLGRLIEDKARDMTELLSNVLELMRLETGPGSLKREWHALEDLVGQTLRQNEGRIARWPVIVEPLGDLPMLYVESNLIVQTLSNLVENCVKYTPPGTTITIGARSMAPSVVIFIEDDGPGLGSGDPERLFEKFERGRTESNITGVGLGLAICRAVARLHGGDIRALSAKSGGARFEITLPAPTQPPDPDQLSAKI
jgi:two-component system sensor histidine kinase KdpD